MRFVSKKRAKTGAFLLCLVLLVLVALDVSSAVGSDPMFDDEKTDLYFPPAPETPRIKYLNSLSSPKDWKLKRSSFIMRLLRKIVGLDDRNSRLIFPYGVTTDNRQRLIVADSKAQRIHVFDPRKKKYFAIKAPKRETFVSLIGVATDAENNIYVSDSYTGKMFVFNRKGK